MGYTPSWDLRPDRVVANLNRAQLKGNRAVELRCPIVFKVDFEGARSRFLSSWLTIGAGRHEMLSDRPLPDRLRWTSKGHDPDFMRHSLESPTDGHSRMGDGIEWSPTGNAERSEPTLNYLAARKTNGCRANQPIVLQVDCRWATSPIYPRWTGEAGVRDEIEKALRSPTILLSAK
jgi:hypothetical protein